MNGEKKSFIEFMLDSGVLKFGDFITKSGRKTPYFINTGLYNTGYQLTKLGEFYAKAIKQNYNLKDIDVIFGPAYKGIPIVVATAVKLKELYDFNVGFLFNRKEAKDHGEGGKLVGAKLKDGARVLILEDVITAGTSIYETVPLLRAVADIKLQGLLVSVDRGEKAKETTESALATISKEFNMKVSSIVSIHDIVNYIASTGNNKDTLNKIDDYLKQYGA